MAIQISLSNKMSTII